MQKNCGRNGRAMSKATAMSIDFGLDFLLGLMEKYIFLEMPVFMDRGILMRLLHNITGKYAISLRIGECTA